eukprot:TRINITY_DN843_c0_g1_i4.p1 TRINITY_DN843_c0_g1~~TRINITY_DN843_c0_g1_i4.p1  ORF type:complete len:170 (+),score=20.53 TRINITY_DN843_c0_g1_i4:32-541(+)
MGKMKISVQVVLLLAFAAVSFGCSIEKCYQQTGLQCCGIMGCVLNPENCVYYSDFCEVTDCTTSCCINNRCCTEDELKIIATLGVLFWICVCCVIPGCCIYCCCFRSRTSGQFVPFQPQAQYHHGPAPAPSVFPQSAPIPQQMNFPNQPSQFQPQPVVQHGAYAPPPQH